MTNAVIRKVMAAVAAVFLTLTGAWALTIETTTDIYGHTFSYTLDHNNNATIVRSEDYKTFSGLVALPASCGGNNVSAVGERAFADCPKLEAVILPNSIERIGAYAFANCPVLSYVGRALEGTGGVSILPDKTKHIGMGAFDGTAVLGLSYPPGAYWGIDESTNTTTKTVTIPGWAKAVPNGAFKNFVALETVKIESGVTAIGKGAFEGCKALKSIEIPSTVSTIMDKAFGDCYVEGKVVRIQSIESWCQVDFEGSSANPLSNGGFGRAELWVMGSRATDLQIPATVREIKPYVFVKLDLPGDLEIPGQVKKIGEHAFAGLCCGGEISFGEGLEEIGEQAFYGAAFDRVRESETAVGTIEFPRSLKKIGEQAFNSFDNLGTVKFGGVREVGEGAFERCSRLVALDFGASSSVTNIGRKAFANCDSLCFAVIPASVVCMGTQVFSASWRLSKVCYQGNCPRILPWGSEKVNDVTIADFASYVRPGSRGWNGTPGSTDKPLNWEGGRLGSWDESGLLVRPNADGSEHAIGGCMLAGTRLVTLPAEVGGVAITSIAPRAFEGDTAITGVTVADGIRDVGAHAFSESFVSDVILPNSVSNIGERAFGEMLPYLRTLAVGEGLVNVAPDAFEGNFTQKPTVTVYSPAEKVEMLQTVFKGTEPEIFPRYIDKIVFKTDEGAPKITTATIRLTWNPNGGWDTQRGWDTPPQTFQEGVTVAAVLQASPVPARQGYHFRGWSFSLEKWLPADDPSRQSMSLTENQTLYAWWTAATDGQIYVTWDAMDGKASPAESKFTRGIKVKDLLKKAPKPTRTGWTFGGWYWDVDLTDPLNDPDSQDAAIEFDVIFFAKWTGGASTAKANVTVDVTGSGTGKVTGAGEYAAGKKVTLKATADTKDAPAAKPATVKSVFAGWYDGDVLLSLATSYVIDEMPPEDVKLTAKFIALADDRAAVSFTLPKELINDMTKVSAPVDVSGCTSLPTVKVAGLPAGLKFTDKDILKKGSKTEVEVPANTIYGTATKSGFYEVVVTVTTAGKQTASASQKVFVRKADEFVLDVACDETMGKATGAGVYQTGKSVTLKATANAAKKATKTTPEQIATVFAGWYADADFTTPLEGAADYRNPSFAYVMPGAHATAYAKFVAQTDDVAAVSFELPAELTNGVTEVNAPVDVSGCTSLPTVKVTGLPTGLKFTDKDIVDAKTKAVTVPANTIYGTATKSGFYDVVATVTTAGKQTDSMSQKVFVRKPDEFVLDVAFDAAAGKATGAGVYQAGKSVTLKATANAAKKATKTTPEQIATVFAGWYADAGFTTPLEGAADFRSPSFAYVMPDAHTTVYAQFVAQTDDVAAVSFELPAELTNGVTEVNAPVDVSLCASLPTVKVTGLPTGLKFDAKANVISGTATKSGVYDVVVTVTTAGKKTAGASRTVVVRKDGEKVVLAAVPEVGGAVPGKVTGPGVYAKGKDVTLKATANKGYVFAGWWEGGELKSPDASYKFKMGEVDVAFTAKFVTLAEEAAALRASLGDEPLSTAAPLEIYASCGVDLSWSLAANGITANAIAVSGLPTGLKFTAKDIVDAKTKKVTVPANTIYGVPTKASAVTKDWRVVPFAVKVTVTTAGKQKVVYPVNVTTYELPDYAVGTYNGALYDADTNLAGTATLTVTAKGAASGKLVDADGVTWTVKAASYASTDETLSTFCADLAATAKVGGKSVERVFRAAVTYTDCGGRVEAAEDEGAFLVARQDLWKGAYKDDGAKLFRTGKNKYRVFEGVEAEGLEDGQSLMLKVEPSGKVTATLRGGAYVPTASATLVPLTLAGLPAMDAEATFVFLPNAAKKFAGQAVKATIRGIEDPDGPPAPVTRSWAGGMYAGSAMPMIGGVSQSYLLSAEVRDGALTGSFSNGTETVAIPACPLTYRKYAEASGGKSREVEEFVGTIASLTLGGEMFANVKVTVQPNYSAEGYGMVLLSTDDWSLSVSAYQNPWSVAGATAPTFPAEGVSVASSGDTYLFRNGGLVTVTFAGGGSVVAQAVLEASEDGVFTVSIGYWHDYGSFAFVETKYFTMPASGAIESGDIEVAQW